MCKNCKYFPCTREECDISSHGCEYKKSTVTDLIEKENKNE